MQAPRAAKKKSETILSSSTKGWVASLLTKHIMS